MDNNGLKITFVAVMLVLTFWSRNALNAYPEKPERASATESSFLPVRASVVETLPASQPAVSKESVLSAHPVVQKPSFYPKTNFDERMNALGALTQDKATAVLISDIDDGENIVALNEFQGWPIASLTKLMTAVVAIEQIGLDKEIPVSQAAYDTYGEAGNLQPGEKFLASDLLKALLQVSSNDAASALAEFKGQEEFIRLMNVKAHELKMSDYTRFVDPTGLDPRNQSTLTDLKKLITYIYNKYPNILRISREKTDHIKDLEKGTQIRLANINEFAGQNDFLGGKTGFIEESGGNLLSLFSRYGHPILVLVFGSEDRFGITRELLNWFKDNYAATTGY